MSTHKRHRPRYHTEQHVRVTSPRGEANATILTLSGGEATVRFWDRRDALVVPVASLRPWSANAHTRHRIASDEDGSI
jgi:hypothetical protein